MVKKLRAENNMEWIPSTGEIFDVLTSIDWGAEAAVGRNKKLDIGLEHFEKQSWFLTDIEPDIVGRVEEIEEFRQRLGLEAIPRLRWNRYTPKELDEDLISAVKEYYFEDYLLIEKFFG
jgi:hypothetical protein